jgi:VWFA-related protein
LKVRLRAGLALVLAALSSGRAEPQEPLRLAPAVAQLVVVDVFVTDSKGRPVSNLVASDFEMLDDHRRVEIAAFEGPKSGPEASAPSRAPAGAKSAPLTSTRDAELMVIYIDRKLLGPAGRIRAVDQTGALARDHLKAGGRVVVVAEDGPLRPMTKATTSLDEIQTALARIKAWATTSPGASHERTVLELFKDIIDMHGCLPGLPQMIDIGRDYARWRGIEAQEARDRLNGLVDALVGLPGRKALVYVSEGLEQRPGIHLFEQITTICPEVLASDSSQVFAAMQELETSPLLKDAAARANAARVTFYPLDARGMMSATALDPSRGDRRYIPSPKNDFIRDANMVNPYQLLAEETGGFPLVRGLTPDVASKRLDAEALGHYVLGFTPARDADGKAHDITVHLRKERKVEIRHRRSYLHAEPSVVRAQRVLSALFFGLEEDALHATLDIQRGPAVAILKISLPLASLRFEDGEAGRQARVRVVIAHQPLDGEGKKPAIVREKEISIGTPAQGTTTHEILVEVQVDEASREFAVGIEDRASGATTWLRRTLTAAPVRD